MTPMTKRRFGILMFGGFASVWAFLLGGCIREQYWLGVVACGFFEVSATLALFRVLEETK